MLKIAQTLAGHKKSWFQLKGELFSPFYSEKRKYFLGRKNFLGVIGTLIFLAFCIIFNVGVMSNNLADEIESKCKCTKLREILRNGPCISTEEVLKLLSFSDTEREYVERTTSKQWQCEEWYLNKAGFIIASKCKSLHPPGGTGEK